MLEELSKDEFEILLDDIDKISNNPPIVPIVDFNKEFLRSKLEELLEVGVPFSEIAKRQTGRTTRMIYILAEAVRRNEVNGTFDDNMKRFMIVAHNSNAGKDLLRRLVMILENRGMKPIQITKDFVNYQHTSVRMRSLPNANPMGFSASEMRMYDDVFIDNSVSDIFENKIKDLLLNERRT
jgi:hypothetical protein